MRVAASSIAWPVELDRRAAAALVQAGAGGVELAPTRIWADLSGWSPAEADAHRDLWTEHGLDVIGMQALLYGQPHLSVFGEASERRRTLDYLAHVIDIAHRWSARVLVFGSPKNRRVGDLDRAEAEKQARDFFTSLAERAEGAGCVIGLEANPVQYECDFLTRSDEAIEFVESVGHPGLGCHLDLGGMILGEEDPAAVVGRPETIAHFHASEPYLDGLGSHAVAHRAAGRALRGRGYEGWVSIEMRSDPDDPIEALERAVEVARAAYSPEDSAPPDV